ncbi:MAG: HlyD family efflux transporter periplasmic adaptor subunit [Rhodospirillum sp.]|nr:HlyD family efflux transporter periplasmic adaptor subunit [Rhodospirillum sp.]MCF8488818.1 HlyD family efflux transporter periplasmic adaptor subunit [Rhodospirillum sp.]MCF8500900.1 HlyD family efflux transporter periplasmic adaptor subunit [Rhodospirillum sp.]
MIESLLAGFLALFAPDSPVLQGYVEGDYLHVGPVTAGELTALSVAEGDRVSLGDLLFALDTTLAQAALSVARDGLAEAEARLADMEKGKRPEEMAALAARLEQARAALDLSKTELTRAKALVARGAAPRERLDQAERDYQRDRAFFDEQAQEYEIGLQGERSDLLAAQRAVVGQRRSDVARAEKDLADRRRSAPAAGRVVDVYYRVGEVVPQGAPVLTLLPPDRVKVVFFVPETSLGALSLGQVVPFSCDGCAPGLSAKVTHIGDQVEYTPPVLYSVKFRAKLVVRVEATPTGNALALHPGQPVDIDPAVLGEGATP